MQANISLRFIPLVLIVGGLVLLIIEGLIIRPMLTEQKSTLDFLASFVALQMASFAAATSVLNGVRLWRIGQRNPAQDRFAMLLMGLLAFALLLLIVAWVT